MNDVKKEGFLFLFVAVVLANNCLIFDKLTDLKFLFQNRHTKKVRDINEHFGLIYLLGDQKFATL